MENKLIWLDLEMTGLEPQSERIIEIFTAITNEDLTEVIEGPNIVISQPTEYLDNMDDWNQDHHSRSGLLDEVKKSEISQEDAEMRTLNFIKEHVPEYDAMLGKEKRELSRVEILNRDYYRGRFASKDKNNKIFYNWEKVDLNSLI